MSAKLHQNAQAETESKSSWLKWVLGAGAIVIALMTDHFFPGWGRPVVLTLAIFGTTIGFGKPYWGRPFWAAIAASCALHVPLVLYFRPTINHLPMPVLFVFAAIEILVICAVMGKVVSGRKE